MVNQKGGVLPAVAVGCAPCMAAAGSAIPSFSTIFGVSAVTGAGVVAGKNMKDKNTKRVKKTKKRNKKKNQKGGSKKILTKLQIKNSQRLRKCEKTANNNKNKKKKCLDEFHKTWGDYSKFLKKNAVRKGPRYADRKQYTSKQQREIMKRFFGKDQKGGRYNTQKQRSRKTRKYLKK